MSNFILIGKFLYEIFLIFKFIFSKISFIFISNPITTEEIMQILKSRSSFKI